MPGTEKDPRAAQGEGGYGKKPQPRQRNSGSLAFVAFVLAVGALLLGIAQYTDLAGNAATSANSAAIAEARNQIAALQGRLDALERANQDERAMIIESIVGDMGAKAAFLARQGLSQDQMDALGQALAPVLPRADASGSGAADGGQAGSDTASDNGAAPQTDTAPAAAAPYADSAGPSPKAIAPEPQLDTKPLAPEPVTKMDAPAMDASPAPMPEQAPASAPEAATENATKPADGTTR